MFAASKRKIPDQGPAADNEEVFEVCLKSVQLLELQADRIGG
jgi:hypothetical protein